MSSKLLNSSFLVQYSLLKKHSITVDFCQPGKKISTFWLASTTSKRTEQALSLQFCFQNSYDSNADIRVITTNKSFSFKEKD
jgi:hypothetical protein